MSIPFGAAEWLAFVAELAAKMTLVLLLAAVAAGLLRRSSAAVRHSVWCLGVAAVLVLPPLSALLPAWDLPLLPPAGSVIGTTESASAAAATLADATTAPAEAGPAAQPAGIDLPADPGGARAWLPATAAALAVGGVAAGVLWLALGFWGVARIGRRAALVEDPEWLRVAQEAAGRLGLRRPVLLVRSRDSLMPATWGLLWPAVVLPANADAWPEDRRRAVLAHELAHVKRFDCLTQAMAQLACVLFWWHPGVWYAARRLRVERERACDDLVLGTGTRASDYAAHLLEVARACRPVRVAAPALVSMASPSHLESRLLAVLDAARARNVASRRGTLLALVAALLLVGPLAAMRPGAGRAPTWTAEDRGGRQIHVTLRWDASLMARAVPLAELRGVTDLEVGSRRSVPVAFRIEREAGVIELDGAFRDGRGAGRFRFRPDPRFAAALGALGVRGAAEMSDHSLLALAYGGVTAAQVRELTALGLGPFTAGDLVTVGVFGVTPEYVAWLRASGLAGSGTLQDAVAARVFGVSPEYVREMDALGYRGLSRQQLLQMRIHGVSPSFVRQVHDAGFRGISPERLVVMKIHGIGAEVAAP